MQRNFYGRDFNLIDMRKQGLCDLVFDFIPALEFMFLAVKNGERILGGDIVVKNNLGQFIISDDGWRCENDSPETTFIETLDYFNKLFKNNKSIDFKVSVVTSRYSEHILPLD